MDMNRDLLVGELIDALYLARKALDLLPPLPNGVRKSHLQVMQAIQKITRINQTVRVTDVSKLLNITSPNITKLLNELEEMQMITKSSCSHDKRAVLVELTELGMENVKRYVLGHHCRLIEFSEKIGLDHCQITIDTITALYKEMQKLAVLVSGGK